MSLGDGGVSGNQGLYGVAFLFPSRSEYSQPKLARPLFLHSPQVVRVSFKSFRMTTFLEIDTCVDVTSVGATQGVTETAASLSAGGFSNIFAPPSYQASAVSTYLTALGNTNAGRFNAAGRGFPDVAAQGNDVLIVSGGEGYLVAGTSCSSPIFASVISLINDRLIAAGKPVLGFLNPL